jgi:hypothetical protein
VTARRCHRYEPLDDATYAGRFESLCLLYHPAVAAVMAHDVTLGPSALAVAGGVRQRRVR